MSVTLDSIALPDELVLTGDETSPIAQTAERMVDGTLAIEEQSLDGWREIELRAVSDAMPAVISQSTRAALRSKLSANLAMVLVWHGGTWDVRWNHSSRPVETESVTRYLPHDADSQWFVTLRFFGKPR